MGRSHRIATRAARPFPDRLVPLLAATLLGLAAGGAGAHLATSGMALVQDEGRPRGLWIADGRPTPQATRLLGLLRRAGDEGLDPDRYSIARIERALADKSDPSARGQADRLLSDAFVAYARDLRVPRSDGNVAYIDQELAPAIAARDLIASDRPLGELQRLQDLNPLYRGLRAGLEWYRTRWSRLPQLRIPPGPPLVLGSRGERVALLRRRLGLPGSGDRFDGQLAEAVRLFREVHGLASSPVADRATIAALNLGAAHFERLIALNLDRTRALPIDGRRYIVVDTAGARLRMIAGGREVDAMRVIVGKPDMETPELAGFIRFAIVNPYWNVPPDLVRQSIAPRVVNEGPAHLAQRRYAVFSDWRPSAAGLDPLEVDWSEVAAGRQQVWIRQLPGGDNMMGRVKFMLPNRFGIYLHDTPHKSDFARSDRRLSSGCVRVEDAARLARWLMPGRSIDSAGKASETRIDLPEPVPVYITYLTAVPRDGEVRFQDDVYHRDDALLRTSGVRS